MLESLVANLLNRFLGMYVKNFDPKQLNVGIWSGDVKLRNLQLRKEALDQLHLPLNVVEGYLGELTLRSRGRISAASLSRSASRMSFFWLPRGKMQITTPPGRRKAPARAEDGKVGQCRVTEGAEHRGHDRRGAEEEPEALLQVSSPR